MKTTKLRRLIGVSSFANGEKKKTKTEGVFLRFGDDLAVDDNPHRAFGSRPAKQPLLADLLKVPIWKPPMGSASKPAPTQEENSPSPGSGSPFIKEPKKPLGNTTRNCIKSATKRRSYFGGWKAIAQAFSRFDKLDVIFMGFIAFALIFDMLR